MELLQGLNSIRVLNLVINGLPSIQVMELLQGLNSIRVLNLVINGLPSIPKGDKGTRNAIMF